MIVQTWAVVPAAGRGARFGGPVPKQYLLADGEPLLAHTLQSLLAHPGVAGVMVAIAESDADWPGWTSFADKPVLTCVGGETRAASDAGGEEVAGAQQREALLGTCLGEL